MPDYSVYGGGFRSDLAFPDFQPQPAVHPEWILSERSSPPPRVTLEPVGDECVQEGVYVRLYRLPDGGFRLVYDDTGTFDVSADGSRISWYPGVNADPDAARLDVMGFVFAVAFHAAGIFCLHGSAVALPSGGISFVAPKFHGKSTLARALTRAGAWLASDDAVPIQVGSPAMMRPGIHQVRLWNDSAAHFAQDGPSMRMGFGGKQVLTDMSADQLMLDPVPLLAIYTLVPVKSELGVPAVERVLLAPLQATLSLVSHAKGGALLGKAESAVVLDHASSLACAVPVYALRIARDFDRLPEVVDQLMEWHLDSCHAGAATREPGT